MKIIQLTYALGAGGAERVVVDLANELSKRGHEVIVCAILKLSINPIFSFNVKNLNEKIRYVNLEQPEGFSFAKMTAIVSFIKKERPDVVHCHLNVIPYIFPLALLQSKIKFIHTLHSVAENTSGSGFQKLVNKFFYSKEFINPVCISKRCQDSYNRYYKLNNAPVIDNGRSEMERSSHYIGVKNRIVSLKQTETTKVFIHVARFHPQKNQKLLIESFNNLESEGYDFTLLVIGAGFDTEEGLILQKMASSKIHFFDYLDNVADYLFCSDAFCLTSIYEGLPISLLEAMSCGCIPICTPVGGIPDVIRDGETGYLSKGVSVDEFVDTLKKFIEENEITKETIITHFRENYSIERTVDKYLEVYNG